MRRPHILAFIVFALTQTSVMAAEMPVDLELVLAVDVSSSVVGDEQFLQRQGYVTAFQSSLVIDAIRSGPYGRIAITYVEWGDPNTQNVVLPWMLVDGRASAMTVAYRLAEQSISRSFGTSIAGALLYSSSLFDGNGFRGDRRVIDLSANGPNNIGAPVGPARDAVVSRGVTINGLPIMIHLVSCEGLCSIEGLDRYFEDCVIGGPGAFVLPVNRREDFANTIKRKLILEIVGPNNNLLQQIQYQNRPDQLDCAAIEKSPGRILPLRPASP